MPKKIPENKHGQNETELQSTIDKLNKMLANVLTYISDEEVEVMLFEPASTLNTGNIKNEFTKEVLQKI